MVSGALLGVDLVLWALSHVSSNFKLAWSFGVAVVVVLCDVSAFVLCVTETIVRWREQEPRYQGNEGPISQKDLDTEDHVPEECDAL